MQVQLAAESHVPCFQERVGTSILGYMIPDRLPWRLRARPSATLHEIRVCSMKSKLGGILQPTDRSVKRLGCARHPPYLLPFAAASSWRIFAMVAADESLRFLFFCLRLVFEV